MVKKTKYLKPKMKFNNAILGYTPVLPKTIKKKKNKKGRR